MPETPRQSVPSPSITESRAPARPVAVRSVAAGRARTSGLVIKHISAQTPRRTIALDVGQRDIRISRNTSGLQSCSRSGGGKRGSISRFSRASARRLLFTARNFPDIRVMVTLTYPAEFPCDGERVKDHWRRMRQWLSRNGAKSGLWFLEFQERGAPHFHIFITETLDLARMSHAWYRIVGSGDEKHLRAGTRAETLRKPHAAGTYAAKYASKIDQKTVPAGYEKVGRFWGTWGNAQITKRVVLPHDEGSRLVRVLRLAYRKERAEWQRVRKHFRDNGRAGFIAWEISQKTARLLARYLDPSGDITDEQQS